MGNIVFTQQLVDHLINCEKEIIKPFPKDFKIQSYWKRKEFFAESFDKSYKYSINIRQHIEFSERFTIILGILNFSDDIPRINLLRTNGIHGDTRVSNNRTAHHNQPHIHLITAEDINNGNLLDPKATDQIKVQYIDLQSALLFFL